MDFNNTHEPEKPKDFAETPQPHKSLPVKIASIKVALHKVFNFPKKTSLATN